MKQSNSRNSAFQLTASQGGWHRKHFWEHTLKRTFQLTASQGGWRQQDMIRQLSRKFQLTASQGGWRISDLYDSPYKYFNSQPHKEADKLQSLGLVVRRYFNSQPHKEADLCKCQSKTRCCISTHSLTRRLTLLRELFMICSVFQLTASQGGWLILLTKHRKNWRNFNSQPHKEADDYWESSSVAVFRISTHSLTRRLTVICSEIPW